MKPFPVLLFVVLLATAVAASADEKAPITFSFDSERPNEAPPGFEFARTGNGALGKWVVKAGRVKTARPSRTYRSRSAPGRSRATWECAAAGAA